MSLQYLSLKAQSMQASHSSGAGAASPASIRRAVDSCFRCQSAGNLVTPDCLSFSFRCSTRAFSSSVYGLLFLAATFLRITSPDQLNIAIVLDKMAF